MNLSVLALDGLLAACVVFLVVRSYREGFLRTAVNALGHLASWAVAFVGSRALAEACYQLFFRDRLISSIGDAIDGAAGLDLAGKLSAAMEVLPGFFRTVLAAAGLDAAVLAQEFSGHAASPAQTISVSIADTVLYPVLYMLMQSISFLLLFIACTVLVRCLSRALQKVDRLPLIGSVNALLGAAMGLVEAVVVIFVAVAAVRLLLELTGGFSWLNASIIEGTYLFRLFYHFDLGMLPAF